MENAQAPELLLTSMSHDGTKSGFALDLTRAVSEAARNGDSEPPRFHRQRRTHGQSDRERAPGSVGMCALPGFRPVYPRQHTATIDRRHSPT